MKYKLVIFDLDGTLLDTIADLGDAVNYSLGKHGFPLHKTGEYYAMVGNGVRRLVMNAMPEEFRGDDRAVDSCLDVFKRWYLDNIDRNTVPYPGIPELLESLVVSGCKVAIASNKFQSGVDTLAKKFFPSIPFVATMGFDKGVPLKPDAELIRIIREKAGVEACDAVMVGDSGTDIKTARNAGITSIAVSWGFRAKSALMDADIIVDSSEELLEALS